MTTANINEIFSSIQGEGPLVGQRQIFIRFQGCDLRCEWCDTPESLTLPVPPPMPTRAGARDEKHSVEDILEEIKNLESQHIHHSISFTGGEPLLQAGFIKDLIPEIKKQYSELLMFLETAGHRYKELEEVIDLFDFISFDIKLPSSTGDRDIFLFHEKFLETLGFRRSLDRSTQNNRKNIAKIVITQKTLMQEFEKACELLKKISLECLVIQPEFRTACFTDLFDFEKRGTEILGRGKVLCLSQMHKHWALR